MAEIKTCEQYVLNELEELRNENAALKLNIECMKTTIDFMRDCVDKLQKRQDKIKEILNKFGKVRTFGEKNENKYMTIEINDYCKDEKWAFDKIMRFAHIKDAEEISKED